MSADSLNERTDEKTVVAHRQQFSTLAGKRYFNYGGQGPMADSAIAALDQAQHTIQTQGPFSGEIFSWLRQEGAQIRAAIAQTVGAAPDTITLSENVTVGCNIPLWGLPWEPGDHILLGDCEHPGVIAAVAELSRRQGLAVSTCALAATANAGNPVEGVREALRPNTRLVILSHVLWNTGQLLPLREIADICHANAPQTRLLVDAAQAVGMLPLDQPGWRLPETGVDFYAFTGHKWCCGPAGLGGLYVRPDVLPETQPTFIGWRGIELDEQSNPAGFKANGQRFEVATADYSLWPALRQALATQASWDTSDRRYERICQLSHRLWAGLRQIPAVHCLLTEAPPPSGLVSFQIRDGDGQISPERHSTLVKALEAEKFYLRTLLSPNCVRACVHYLTLESEVDDLLAAVRQFVTGPSITAPSAP